MRSRAGYHFVLRYAERSLGHLLLILHNGLLFFSELNVEYRIARGAAIDLTYSITNFVKLWEDLV